MRFVPLSSRQGNILVFCNTPENILSLYNNYNHNSFHLLLCTSTCKEITGDSSFIHLPVVLLQPSSLL